MSSFQHLWPPLGLIIVGLVILGGCDVPTSEPSLNTDVGINSPLIAAKTYSFIGGPESQNEPLLDTMGTKDKAILHTVEKTSKATGGPRRKLSANQGFSEVLVSKDDDIAEQEIRAKTSLSVGTKSSSTTTSKAAPDVKASGSISINNSSNNADFRAIAPDSESDLTLQVENNADVDLNDVSVSLENTTGAASEFNDIEGVTINTLGVNKSFGDINQDNKDSRTIDSWQDRALKEMVDVTVTASASGTPSASDKIEVCLGGPNCLDGDASVLGVKTLYFISSDETFTTSGNFDLFDSGRFEFGPEASTTIPDPRLSVDNLNIEGTPATPRLMFESFRMRYQSNLTFANGDDFAIDLVQDTDNFDGDATSCPCNPMGSPGGIVTLVELGNAEDVRFKLIADLKSGVPSVLNVGDVAAAEKAGIPVGDQLTVNWGLSGASRDSVTIRDTMNADLSALEGLTDPDNNVNLNTAALQFRYTNNMPLGGDLTLTLVNADGTALNEWADDLTIQPTSKNDDGTAAHSIEETLSLSLGDNKDELRRMSDGAYFQIRIDMTQENGTPKARLYAEDTLRFVLKVDTDASVHSDR